MTDEPITAEKILDALRAVIDPGRGRDIVSLGMVKGLSVGQERVSFVLEVDPARAAAMESVRQSAQDTAQGLPGVTAATVVLTAHAAQSTAAPAPRAPPDLRPRKPAAPQSEDKRIEGVDRIIAIASGKGGVGKSTVASNLAVALAAEGRRVGLLDADVYGPSQPRMLGVSGRPASPDGQTILPLRNHGVTLMSIGLLTAEDEAVVWRGPMLMGALQQMLRQVRWGRLDDLIVDLPPGTGDVQITLAQKAEVTGAIIVSTPQDVALIDARKAVSMFEKVKVPILGVIENMSGYVCPECGAETPIFGSGGARAEAERIGAPFLGALPIDLDTRLGGDQGAPVVAARPGGPMAGRFRAIARQLLEGS